MSQEEPSTKLKKKSASSRRRTQLKLLNENAPHTPHKKRVSRKKLTPKSESNLNKSRRHRHRSDVDQLRASKHNNENLYTHNIEDINFGAAYKKEDIVLTKDTESKMCVIKTIRSQNGLQYGIVIPPESIIRYIKPGKIIKKLQSESVIARIDTITKAYEDANGEMLKNQQQLKMQRKQLQQEKDKFKKLKQRFNDQNSSNQASSKRINELENQNTKLRKDIEQKTNDFNKLKHTTSDDNVYKKQLTEFHKQVKTLNKTITQQKMLINKQRTNLSQQKAQSNRNKLEDVSDSKQIIKLKKEKAKASRTITELRQQLQFERNRTSRMTYENNRVGRKHRLQSEYNLEQLGVQQRKLEQKLKKLKHKEAELDEQEKFQKYQQKDFMLNKNRLSIQQQQDMDAQNKLFNRKKKQEMAEIEKRRQELLRQQKLLEMNNKWDKMKKNKGRDKDNKLKRHARVRGEKTKIIIHKKYLCKEYMDTCVKWRKRKDAMGITSNRLKELEEKLKVKLKRLSKLDENKRISKGKNKLEKPNKSDLKEFLDVSIPLECEMEEELGSLLLELHPEGKNIKNMPLELLKQQGEVERLQLEMEEMRNELNKYRLNKKLNKKLSAIDEDMIDSDDDGGDGGVTTYKLEFSGLYRKVANLEENRDEILSELKSLIDKIGEDVGGENEQNMMQFGSECKENFVAKTQALCDEYSKLEGKLDEKPVLKSKRSKKRKPRRRKQHVHNDTSDSENSYKGTDRIHMTKKQREDESEESDDSSSVMVETDDYDDDWSKPKHKTKGKDKSKDKNKSKDKDENEWCGTQRMSINNKKTYKPNNKMSSINLHKTQQKVDDLSVNARDHLDGLKKKQDEYKTVKQKISANRRDLTQCQGLLEVIEEEDKKTGNISDNEDVRESKESLRVYNELIDKASNNLEDASCSLKKDDERVTQLMQQLQKLQTKIAGKKLKMVQEKFKEIKTQTEVVPPPNTLELQDLRKKINALYQKALHDAEWLEKSMRNIEKNKKKTNKLQDKVEELSPSIHKFARRPQTKIMEYMMEYNYDLGEMANKLKDKQDNLAKFTDKNQDIRQEQGIEVQNEFTTQQTILDEYKKTINILQERHKGIMFENIEKDKRITESGPVYELEKIMDEVSDLLTNTTQKNQ